MAAPQHLTGVSDQLHAVVSVKFLPYSGLFSGGGEMQVMSLRSGFNFRCDSLACWCQSHGGKNSWVEIFMTCRLSTKLTKISTPQK